MHSSPTSPLPTCTLLHSHSHSCDAGKMRFFILLFLCIFFLSFFFCFDLFFWTQHSDGIFCGLNAGQPKGKGVAREGVTPHGGYEAREGGGEGATRCNVSAPVGSMNLNLNANLFTFSTLMSLSLFASSPSLSLFLSLYAHVDFMQHMPHECCTTRVCVCLCVACADS